MTYMQEIAREKAGIMKQGSRVFTSPQLPEAMQSLQVCLMQAIS